MMAQFSRRMQQSREATDQVSTPLQLQTASLNLARARRR
jgi:hypothetical protein